MTHATLTADAVAVPSGIRSITDPRLDRTVAAVASLPFAYMLYYRLAYEGFDLPRIAIAINFALLIGTMVVRRPPVRVTPKPLYWVTAFLATYWGFMTLGLAGFYDVAVRDLVMALGAYTLGSVAALRGEPLLPRGRHQPIAVPATSRG